MQRRTLLAGAAALAVPGAARAQAWPTQPIRMVVPYPPGGSNDVIGRYLADRISPLVGQPFVVENRPGAGGYVGAEFVARSAPDGHTFTIVSNSLVTANPHLVRSNFDPMRDLVMVSRLVSVHTMLVVTPSLRAGSCPTRPRASARSSISAPPRWSARMPSMCRIAARRRCCPT